MSKTFPTIDYPRIRRDSTCPFCTRTKDQGLIACWPCFRRENLRQGETAAQAFALETREQRLITTSSNETSSETWRGI